MARTKNTPADPEAEKAELRQLTRELHEAAQDARGAARELRDALKLVEDTAEDTVTAVITPLCNEVTDGMNQLFKVGEARIDFQVNHLEEIGTIVIDKVGELMKDTEARMLGFGGIEDVEKHVLESIHQSMHELSHDEGFIGDVAEMMSTRVKFILPPSNHMAAAARVAARDQAEKMLSKANDVG